MPVQLTYPGVYIEEAPSGARTVSGTSTSITSFIGRAKRGPVNKPVRVQNFGEFERAFGGLWRASTMSYAVQQYFLNGGGDAVVVRVQKDATRATLKLACGGKAELVLKAATEGTWGNGLRVRVDHEVSADVAASFHLKATALFNLTVHDGKTGDVEEFRNLSIQESPRQIKQVLSNRSKLVRVEGTLPAAIPGAHRSPGAGKTIWNDDSASAKVASDGEAVDGGNLTNTEYEGSEAKKTGIYALDKVDIFNLMCIPPISGDTDIPSGTLTKAAAYCKHRRAMLIMDPPKSWADKDQAAAGFAKLNMADENAAMFFPRVLMPDPLQENRPVEFAPCGAIAGVFARTDTERGVWKAPAGIGASLKGVQGLSADLTDGEHGQLNPIGVNCLRTFPVIGSVIYGARTCKGADKLSSEFKYIPVRRLTLYIEESLYRGTQFAVFEPNDEPLWGNIRFAVTSFMQGLFRKGALQGTTPGQAYFVKCDSETTTQADIDRGIVNIVVGFAPLKPAEFVVVKIQQMSKQG